MNAIIVDDEIKSRDLLERLCKDYCPQVSIIGKASSVNEAIVLIKDLSPDLVFLDIKMPIKNGFALLEHFQNNPPFQVIFNTAYDEYALRAFKNNVVGYLLKPIQIEALVNAVNKAKKIINPAKHQSDNNNNTDPKDKANKIALATTDGFTFVKFTDIIRCEAHGNYTYVFLADDTSLLITKTLKHYEEVLPEEFFFRAHKSHLINLNFVRRFIKGKQGMVEMTDGKMIEVSLRKRERLLELLAY